MRTRDNRKIESIMASALLLINRDGLSRVSVSSIASLARISPATIYIYFQNRDDLVKRLYLRVKSTMAAGICRCLSDRAVPDEMGFKALIREVLNLFMEKRDFFLFLEQVENAPGICPETNPGATEWFEPLLDFLDRGIRSGRIRQMEPRVAAEFLCGSAGHLVKKHFSEEISLVPSLKDQVIEMIWAGIRHPG